MKSLIVLLSFLFANAAMAYDVNMYTLSGKATSILAPSLGVGVSTYDQAYGRLGLTYVNITQDPGSVTALAAQLSYVGSNKDDGLSLSVGGGGVGQRSWWFMPTLNYTQYVRREDKARGFSTAVMMDIFTPLTSLGLGYQESPERKGFYSAFEIGL